MPRQRVSRPSQRPGETAVIPKLERRAPPRHRSVPPRFRGPRLQDQTTPARRIGSVLELLVTTMLLGVLLATVVAAVVGAIVLALQRALNG